MTAPADHITNPWEDRARARKAWDLRVALESHLPHGTKPSQVAAVAREMTHTQWCDVADLAHINRPSPRTVAVALAMLESAARTENVDPFANL